MIKIFKHRFCTRWLFGFIKLTKNTDPDKYGYRGFIIWFYGFSEFSLSNDVGFLVQTIVHQDTMISQGPTQGLDGTATLPKARYSEK